MDVTEVKKWIRKNKPNLELLSFSGRITVKSEFRCRKCGHTWETSISKLKSGRGCPNCAEKERQSANNKSREGMRKWLKQHFPYIEIDDYLGNGY